MTTKTTAGKTAAKRKTTTRRAPRQAPPKPELTEEQRQAKLDAYGALKAAGLDVPKDLAKEVEGWITEHKVHLAAQEEQQELQAKAREHRIADENINGPWYVRNGTNGPFNFRLDRQTERRRIELKPRGTPGDMHPIKDEDLTDSNLIRNQQMGVIEIIPGGEAALIMEKQTTNMGARSHTPFSVLRNHFDQPVTKPIKVETEFNQQGVTVAVPDADVLTGQKSAKGTQFGGLNRVGPGHPQEVASAFVPTGGNPAIISYGPVGRQAEAQADAVARQKNLEGPQAGLGDFRVTVAPPTRT